jgi:hypothetical protein
MIGDETPVSYRFAVAGPGIESQSIATNLTAVEPRLGSAPW